MCCNEIIVTNDLLWEKSPHLVLKNVQVKIGSFFSAAGTMSTVCTSFATKCCYYAQGCVLVLGNISMERRVFLQVFCTIYK